MPIRFFIITASLCVIAFAVFSPLLATAQVKPLDQGACDQLGIKCPEGDQPLKDWVFKILGVALGFVGILGLIMIIYAGAIYIIARGDEKETERAKRIIIYTVLGLIVIALSAAIINFIINSFK